MAIQPRLTATRQIRATARVAVWPILRARERLAAIRPIRNATIPTPAMDWECARETSLRPGCPVAIRLGISVTTPTPATEPAPAIRTLCLRERLAAILPRLNVIVPTVAMARASVASITSRTTHPVRMMAMTVETTSARPASAPTPCFRRESLAATQPTQNATRLTPATEPARAYLI